nr:flagellar hook-associated protein FlgK [uncultured Anaeromusa sp.]
MSTIWSGYSVSYSGMSTAQRSLGVTSSNISNTSTEGYTRKRAVGQDLYVSGDTSATGIGATVQSILRVRNQFLDIQYREQNTETGYAQGKSSLLASMQEVINEFNAIDKTSAKTSNGLQETMNKFLSSWTELSKDPTSASCKSSVLENADAMLGAFNEMTTTMLTLRESMVNNVRDGVGDVNNLAGQIATLNDQILQMETRNVEASDLRDARDLLIDKVSALTNITTSEMDNGMVNVYVNGVSLVSGNKAKEMEATGLGTATNPLKVQWKDLNEDVSLTGGALKCYLDEADSSGVDSIAATPYNWSTTADKSALTTMTNGLNDLLVTFAAAVNNVYNPTHVAGQDFFTTVDGTATMGLKNVQVNTAYEADYTKIKANSDGTAGNNDISKAIGVLSSQSGLYQCDGISMNMDTFYSSFVSWLGTTGDTATANYSTQSGLLTQIQTQRNGLSSVSLDDEMSTMITYQHAYSASARVMNVVDTLVAGLISDLGG